MKYEVKPTTKFARDWLLVYEKSKETLILYLTRTGTHSDLF